MSRIHGRVIPAMGVGTRSCGALCPNSAKLFADKLAGYPSSSCKQPCYPFFWPMYSSNIATNRSDFEPFLKPKRSPRFF